MDPSLPLPLSNRAYAGHYDEALLVFTRVQRIAVELIHKYVDEVDSYHRQEFDVPGFERFGLRLQAVMGNAAGAVADELLQDKAGVPRARDQQPRITIALAQIDYTAAALTLLSIRIAYQPTLTTALQRSLAWRAGGSSMRVKPEDVEGARAAMGNNQARVIAFSQARHENNMASRKRTASPFPPPAKREKLPRRGRWGHAPPNSVTKRKFKPPRTPRDPHSGKPRPASRQRRNN